MKATRLCSLLLLTLGLTACTPRVRLDPITPVATDRLPVAVHVEVPPSTANATPDVYSYQGGGCTIEVGRAIVQALVFLPWAVPSFLAGLNWSWLFNPVIGPIPHWLYALGLMGMFVPEAFGEPAIPSHKHPDPEVGDNLDTAQFATTRVAPV